MRSFLDNQRIRAAFVTVSALVAMAVIIAIRGNVLALTIVWSALIVTSFVGWGSLVNMWLARGRWMDAGIRAGWGMGLVLATGGYLSVAHAAVRPVLFAQVILGVAALLWTWVIRRPPIVSARRFTILVGRAGVVILVLGGCIITAFLFCVYLSKHDFQPSDDPPLYFALPKKLLDTGSLYEPFNPRRITTLGGQPYLHALFTAVAPFYYLHVVDGGIGLVLTFLLLVGHFSRTGLKGWHAAPLGLALILLFTLLPMRVNIASEVTGVPVILTLYRTLRLPLDNETDAPLWPMEPRRIVVIAVLVVVATLLRTSNMAAILPFIFLVLASDFVLGTRRPWQPEAIRSFAYTTGIFAVAFAVVLLPWSIMLRQSCNTFFFPLQKGNLTPGWTFLRPTPLRQAVGAWMADVSYDKPISVFVPFAVAGLVPRSGRARNDLVFMTLGSLIGVWALAHDAGAFDAFAHARYSHAYLVATALAISMSAGRTGARASLVAVAVAMHITTTHEAIRSGYIAAVDYVSDEFKQGTAQERAFAAGSAAYADIQGHVPAGATIATAVLEPWRFSFNRNRIYTLDLLGGAGPKPGWPVFKGAPALLDYFRNNGIRYLIATSFDTSHEFYGRSHWQLFTGNDYLGGEAPFQLDGMAAIDKIATLRRVVYQANSMTIVDLDTLP